MIAFLNFYNRTLCIKSYREIPLYKHSETDDKRLVKLGTVFIIQVQKSMIQESVWGKLSDEGQVGDL